ncbi:hypothetical protein EJB05_36249, partial [Eragrostis curvula]
MIFLPAKTSRSGRGEARRTRRSPPSPVALKLDTTGAVPELVLWNGSTKVWRSGPWDGTRFTGVLDAAPNSSYVDDDQGVAFGFQNAFQARNSSTLSRLVLNASGDAGSGLLQRWTWSESEAGGAWNHQCDAVSRCGPNAVCNASSVPLCSCLQGFTQRSPALSPWDGCELKTSLDCANGTDEFTVVRNVMVPDTGSAVVDHGASSLEQCRKTCLRNCSCTAYATLNASSCIMWTSDLADLRVFPDSGQDLYVRVATGDFSTFHFTPPHANASHIHPPTKSMKKARIIISTVTSIAALAILALTGLFIWRAKARKSGNGDLELPMYDLKTIQAATEDFSINNKLGEGTVNLGQFHRLYDINLGEGGFGPVYKVTVSIYNMLVAKGKLEDGQEIAVKTLSRTSRQGIDQFKNEVMLIAKLQHRNLVRLVGCCSAGEENMLICEYMPNKSLDYFLFGTDRTPSMPLDWQTRYHIIDGIARGLLYLQQDYRYRILHRDLKPSNILLDKDMIPKISDFGLARMFGAADTEIKTANMAGTLGYMAPELKFGVFSVKSDVFSFGVIVMEIIAGKKNRAPYGHSRNLNLVEHAWRLWNEGKGLDIVDDILKDGSFSADEVLKCIRVGLLCVQASAEDRPEMSEVLHMLASSDTSALQNPNPPGFAPRRDTEDTQPSRTDGSVADSMTSTLIEGR